MKTHTGTQHVVRFVVNRKNGGLEVGSVDVLYSINAKKEPGANYGPGAEQNVPASSGSTISISDFLNTVKEAYSDVLSGMYGRQT